MPLKDLLQGVAIGSRDDDTVLSLANRLVRLAKQLDDKAQARIEKAAGGMPVARTGQGLIAALDPDAIVAAAHGHRTKPKASPATEDTLTAPREIAARAHSACRRLRTLRSTRTARRDRNRPPRARADSSTISTWTRSPSPAYSAQAEAQARRRIQTFADYIAAAQGRNCRA